MHARPGPRPLCCGVMQTPRLRPLAALILAASAAHAQARPIPYPIDFPKNYVDAIEDGTRTRTGAPGPHYWQDNVEYAIDATLDVDNVTLRATIAMTYTNRSGSDLDRLVIHFRQNLHQPGIQRTRTVAVLPGMTVENVYIDDEKVPLRIAGSVGTVRLPEPLADGESTTISMGYSYEVPPAGQAPRNGHEDKHVFYFAYWYPQFAMHDDIRGWVADQYKGNGEFYMPYGNYDISFTVPADWLVRATGTLTNAAEVLPETTLAKLATARTTRELQQIVTKEDLESSNVTIADEGVVTWKFRAENVRDVAVSTSDRYLWTATHAVVEGRDPVDIHAVYEAESRTWPLAADYARHTIEWMSANVYPYPWPHMTACEGIIGGGMEFPMMTLIGERRRPAALQSVTAHELIHMWFPMIVGSNEKAHAWQDEGTTSFFTDLVSDDYYERGNRRNSMRGYRLTARRGQETAMMTHADYYPTGFGFASYTKPAALLHQMREMMRDGERDVFMKAIRTYASEWAMKHPTPYDMWATFERFAGRDLDWYWRAWYYETWTLDHAVARVVETDVMTRVTIRDVGRVPMDCTVEVTYGEGENERRTIPAETWLTGATEITLEFRPGVSRVRIDPERNTLDLNLSNNGWPRRGSN